MDLHGAFLLSLTGFEDLVSHPVMFNLTLIIFPNYLGSWSNLRCWLKLAICFPHSGHGSLAWKWTMAMLARDNGDEDDNDNDDDNDDDDDDNDDDDDDDDISFDEDFNVHLWR